MLFPSDECPLSHHKSSTAYRPMGGQGSAAQFRSKDRYLDPLEFTLFAESPRLYISGPAACGSFTFTFAYLPDDEALIIYLKSPKVASEISCLVGFESSQDRCSFTAVCIFSPLRPFCEFRNIHVKTRDMLKPPFKFRIRSLTKVRGSSSSPALRFKVNVISPVDIESEDIFNTRGKSVDCQARTHIETFLESQSSFDVFFSLPGHHQLYGPLGRDQAVRAFFVSTLEPSFFLIPRSAAKVPIFFFEYAPRPLFFGVLPLSAVASQMSHEYFNLTVNGQRFDSTFRYRPGAVFVGHHRSQKFVTLAIGNRTLEVPWDEPFSKVLAILKGKFFPRSRAGIFLMSGRRVLGAGQYPHALSLSGLKDIHVGEAPDDRCIFISALSTFYTPVLVRIHNGATIDSKAYIYLNEEIVKSFIPPSPRGGFWSRVRLESDRLQILEASEQVGDGELHFYHTDFYCRNEGHGSAIQVWHIVSGRRKFLGKSNSRYSQVPYSS
jgi:hypothetical protein